MDLLMRGIMENERLEKLDFSDNELTDENVTGILRYIKKQAESRDSALWMSGLRHSKFEQLSSKRTNHSLQQNNFPDEQILNMIIPNQILSNQRENNSPQ